MTCLLCGIHISIDASTNRPQRTDCQKTPMCPNGSAPREQGLATLKKCRQGCLPRRVHQTSSIWKETWSKRVTLTCELTSTTLQVAGQLVFASTASSRFDRSAWHVGAAVISLTRNDKLEVHRGLIRRQARGPSPVPGRPRTTRRAATAAKALRRSKSYKPTSVLAKVLEWLPRSVKPRQPSAASEALPVDA